MKKKYINPELVIVKIATGHQMLAGSGPAIFNGDGTGELPLDPAAEALDPYNDEDEVLSRESDFDFDGEDF